MPFVAPLTKLAKTAGSPDEIAGLVDEALATSMAPHSGPTFLDFPMDHVFSEGARAGRPGALHDVLAEPIARRRRRQGHCLARRRGAPGDHGRHEPLLGPRRARAARAGRGAGDPGVPERPGARLPARRPRPLLLARARRRAEGRGPRAGHRRPDGLPPRLRRLVRRGHQVGGHRPRRAGPRAPAAGRGLAVRRDRRDAARAGRRRLGRRAHAPTGSRTCAARRPRSARPSAPSWTTAARRCTRCGCTASSARSWTATRS